MIWFIRIYTIFNMSLSCIVHGVKQLVCLLLIVRYFSL